MKFVNQTSDDMEARLVERTANTSLCNISSLGNGGDPSSNLGRGVNVIVNHIKSEIWTNQF
jgi:hypothetical protein